MRDLEKTELGFVYGAGCSPCPPKGKKAKKNKGSKSKGSNSKGSKSKGSNSKGSRSSSYC
jgi:hypothetical protein